MELQPKIIELLYHRGIQGDEELEEFLASAPKRTHDPFLLHNMEEGVDFLLSAIQGGKKICIYGDYDADGITSTVVMWECLSALTQNLMYYIPSRFEEGYGLNKSAIDRIMEQGAEFILTVDCGSVSVEEVEYAKEQGLDILVTDHHTVTDKIADCLVINPNQPDCHYPCPSLCGCGVAFKLCQALQQRTGFPRQILTHTLDMVGIGTIGDIVPLVDENRTLAKYGLRAINTGARRNLTKLTDAVGLKRGQISAENVSFVIVPHLNASGRMEHAHFAVDLFLSEEETKVEENVGRLCHYNQMRKKIQEEIFREARAKVELEQKNKNFFLVDMGKAQEGVTGIVAGKMTEELYRPTVILTDTGEDCLKGTGRSIPSVNLYEVLKVSEDLFERFGGHAAACGFTIRKDRLPLLRENVDREMERRFAENPELFQRYLEPDMILEGTELNEDLIRQLDCLEPCGCGNERPRIGVRGQAVDLARMGSEGQYMRFNMKLSGGQKLGCVAFRNVEKLWEAAQLGVAGCEAVGALSLKQWNGRVSMQMIAEALYPWE